MEHIITKSTLPANNTPIARIDFETRLVGDKDYLKKHNAYNYSKHKNCKIMCLAYNLPGSNRVRFWYDNKTFRCNLKAATPPQDLLDYIAAGGLVEAHNMFFEFCIWNHIAVSKYGWPELKMEQTRCSQAKATFHSIPADLENAAKVMDAKPKNEEGKKLMLLMTSSYAYDNITNIKKLIQYCIDDVVAEVSFGDLLSDLPEIEEQVWLETLRMNYEGIAVDRQMVESAIQHIEYYTTYVNNQLEELIAVPRTTMRARIKDWFAATGCPIENTQAEYIRDLLTNPPEKFTPVHIRVLELMQTNNLTSIKKYAKTLQFISEDDKVRSNWGYHGGHTGRFTSYGLQFHNFPREPVKNMDITCKYIIENIPSQFTKRTEGHGGANRILSKALRGMVVPSDKYHKLIVSDYSAIEARILFWVAQAYEALALLAAGEDIYCALASRIYRTTITKADAIERQMGKQSILGLGYGMGAITFLATLRKYGISFTLAECKEIAGRKFGRYYQMVTERFGDQPIEDRAELALCQYIVDIYRSTYPEVPFFWKNIERAALRAQPPFQYKKPFMQCILPSGKPIFYPYPSRMDSRTPWGEPSKEFTCYLPHSGKFSKQHFYGGKITENYVQAIAREVLCEALLNVAKSQKYTALIHKHDELVAEAIDPNIEEFDKLMLDVRPWAKNIPLAVETHITNRWQKF